MGIPCAQEPIYLSHWLSCIHYFNPLRSLVLAIKPTGLIRHAIPSHLFTIPPKACNLAQLCLESHLIDVGNCLTWKGWYGATNSSVQFFFRSTWAVCITYADNVEKKQPHHIGLRQSGRIRTGIIGQTVVSTVRIHSFSCIWLHTAVSTNSNFVNKSWRTCSAKPVIDRTFLSKYSPIFAGDVQRGHIICHESIIRGFLVIANLMVFCVVWVWFTRITKEEQ